MEQKKNKSKLMIILAIVIVVIVILLISVIFRGSKKENTGSTEVAKDETKEIEIGETFTNGEWEYIINSIEYDYILNNTIGKDYFTPMNKNREIQYTEKQLKSLAYSGMYPYCSDSMDEKYALVCVECKYNGKNEVNIRPQIIFEYDGYTFKQTELKGAGSLTPLPGKESNTGFKIATLLPTNITEDNEKPIILNFSDNYNNKFKIKINNKEIPDYTK